MAYIILYKYEFFNLHRHHTDPFNYVKTASAPCQHRLFFGQSVKRLSKIYILLIVLRILKYIGMQIRFHYKSDFRTYVAGHSLKNP